MTNIFSLATLSTGLVVTLATRFLYDLDLSFKSIVKTNIHIILLCFRHKKCAKLHKQSQFTSKFIPTFVRDIFKQSNLMDSTILWDGHLNYTNWHLNICIWWLYFSKWLPKGNLRILLILSPAGNVKLVCTGCCQNTFVINIFLFLAEGKLHYFIPQPSLQERLRGIGLWTPVHLCDSSLSLWTKSF